MARSTAQPVEVPPQKLCACCEVARWLYAPAEVWPYLRQELGGDAALPLTRRRPVVERLEDLLRWVRRRVERAEDAEPFLDPQAWLSPGEVMWHGSGSGAELALVLWSAAPLCGLPPGRLVIGALSGAPHAWVEWPELGLFGDAAMGVCGALSARPASYLERLAVWPPIESEGRSAA